jgi:hypothetical protein
MDDGVAMKRRLVGLLISLYAAIIGGDLAAETLLTVHPGGGASSVELSRADLAALPQGEVLTSNEFVDGEALFRGPLAREVLKSCGSRVPETVTMTAVNDYQIEVPTSEFFAYRVILATEMDGVELSSRDKGPIWMIYPMSGHAELRDPVFNSRLIWQLIKMDCR